MVPHFVLVVEIYFVRLFTNLNMKAVIINNFKILP